MGLTGKTAAFLSLTLAAATASGAEKPDGARWWGQVKVLADDAMEGRDTGSEGHRKAAAYVAAEFAKAGLKPAGTDGYLQPVKLKSKRIDEPNSRLTLVGKDGKEVPVALGTDAVISL